MKRLQLFMAVLALAGAALLPASAGAANREGALTLSPFAGYYRFEGNQIIAGSRLDDSPVYGLALGYNLSERLGLEAVAAYVQAEAETGGAGNIDVYQGRLDLLYHFRPGRSFVPYVAGGLGIVSYNPGGDVHNDENGIVDFGAGFKYFFNDSVAFRADARGLLDIDTEQDSREHDAFKHLAVTGGLTFQFGGKESVRPTEVEKVAEPVAVLVPDSDGDGVNDSRDRCPDTPAGVSVDADGCTQDSDGDGVSDALDACPGTPAGVTVDATGCPPADADGDGVVDGEDKCPNTPAGMKVNLYGCPNDEDKDGVFDYEDACPVTPVGTPVGPDGCPLPAEPVSMTLQLDFETNSARIRPEFDDELRDAAEFIRNHPDTRMVVEGHTDSIGTAAYNQRLSQKRAESVRTYLVEHYGVAPERIEAIGYGEERPVAENNTPEGRLMNRRVVITIQE